MWGRKSDWEKREGINNNAAIIMSLAPKEMLKRGVFLNFMSLWTTRGEREGSSSSVLFSHLLVASTFLQYTKATGFRAHYQ